MDSDQPNLQGALHHKLCWFQIIFHHEISNGVVLGKSQLLRIKGIGKRIRLTNDITNISNAYGSQLAQLDFILQHRNH